MRKLIAAAIVAASVLLVSSNTALAASAVDDQFYVVTTSPSGHIECGRYRDEIGDALAPGYIYVNVWTFRQQNLYCANAWNSNSGSSVGVNPKVWAYSPFGVWFVCYDPPGAGNPVPGYSAQSYWTFPSCGHLPYYVETQHTVALWNGVNQVYVNTPSPYPITIG